jgi:hypothetical protein
MIHWQMPGRVVSGLAWRGKVANIANIAKIASFFRVSLFLLDPT